MGADVLEIDYWRHWSLNQFSKEFGIARETVAKRIDDAGIKSSGIKKGFPVYKVGEVAAAILNPVSQTPSSAFTSPDMMSPSDRRHWYASEKDRLAFEKEAGFLVSVDDARKQIAEVAKTGLQILETLPDILERDHGISPEMLEDIEETIYQLRIKWAEELLNE